MDGVQSQLKNTLTKHGYSLTRPRRAIFSVLQDSEPLAVRDLIIRAMSVADRSSVYRTLQIFEKLGIIQRLQIGWKYKVELSDIFSSHHHHLTCESCGALVSLEEDPLVEQNLRHLAQAKGYTQVKHHLEMTGFCPICSKEVTAK